MKRSTTPIVMTGILAALASILFFVEIPIVLFYKLDLSNLPVLIATFAIGPIYGLFTLLIKDIFGLLHSSSGGVGELADFLVGLVFVMICGLSYKRNKTQKTAVIALTLSTLLASVVGVLLNQHLLIPLFLPQDGLAKCAKMANALFPFIHTGTDFLLFITAPFNILKGLIVSVLTLLLYKKTSHFLFRKERI